MAVLKVSSCLASGTGEPDQSANQAPALSVDPRHARRIGGGPRPRCPGSRIPPVEPPRVVCAADPAAGVARGILAERRLRVGPWRAAVARGELRCSGAAHDDTACEYPRARLALMHSRHYGIMRLPDSLGPGHTVLLWQVIEPRPCKPMHLLTDSAHAPSGRQAPLVVLSAICVNCVGYV